MSAQPAVIYVESIADKIDEFVELTKFLAEYVKLHDELKAEIAAEANLVQSEEEYTVLGHRHKLVFSDSPKMKTLEVTDPNLLLKLYGLGVFKPDLTAIADFDKLNCNNKAFIKKREKLLGVDKVALGWKWGSRRLLARNFR
jgi:hypothetical protein